MEKEKRVLTRDKLIERSILTTYRATLWAKFVKAIKDYELLKEGDHVCVCISGGKDSMLLAKLFQELKRHSDFPFEVTYLVMNPGYNEVNLNKIKENLSILNIPAEIVDSDIFDVANSQEKSPCYLCARMRRGCLYDLAKKRGCNKIALGHHYDDVIETTLMNMLQSGSIQTMMPKLHSDNFEGMELIRPLYLVREQDIIRWANFNNLEFIRCACRFTESIEKEEEHNSGSKRYDTKKLIQELKEYCPRVEKNIFKSVTNINLEMVLGYKTREKQVNFLDTYDEKGEE